MFIYKITVAYQFIPKYFYLYLFVAKRNQFTASSASSQKNGCEVTGINAVEKNFVTTSIQKLYDKYQHKTNLPEKCNLTEFMMVIDCLVHKEFKDMPERESSENSVSSFIFEI